ncbi:CPBP family intramembrane glutamic endopeptidase [Raineyella antarctica]|uniref:CPBP family intramembrane glutamic endopeptidase n=1 Tax=Raineyella antarctica TaxID=1577474 RepID=UPI00158801AA|nr:CPBP family intramembrane glutamic endopeptidase [Raineyella antarctica]
MTYPSLLRRENVEPWQTVMGIITGFVFYGAVLSVLPYLVIWIGWMLSGQGSTFAQFLADARAYLNPAGMVAMNLVTATLIPVSWLLVASIHRTRPRWLASVRGGIRWRYLAVCVLLAVLVLNVMQLVTWRLTGAEIHLQPQHGFWGYMVVVLLTTWAQATGEEYFFRGYLMQALGSLARSPWFAVVASAFLFAVMHGSQNVPLFLNRLAFGLVAAVLVMATGGLEAGIAGHVVNNIFAYVWAGLTTGIAATRGVTEMGWLGAIIGVGGYAVYALAAWGVARAMRLRTRSAGLAT